MNQHNLETIFGTYNPDWDWSTFSEEWCRNTGKSLCDGTYLESAAKLVVILEDLEDKGFRESIQYLETLGHEEVRVDFP